MTRKVLIPVLFDELKKLEIVLHLALDEGLNTDGFIDLVLGKCVCPHQYMCMILGGEGTHSAIL